MRDLLNKGFEALGRRDERREEKWDALLTDHVEAMSHRPTLKKYVYVLGGINLLLWAAVLIRPYDVQTAFLKVSGVDDRLGMLVLTTIFGIGMWLTYALFRLKFPNLEESKCGDEIMASFAHQENAYRKVRVWVASVSGGVLNLLALAIAELLLIS
jgi:hypothetical protein